MKTRALITGIAALFLVTGTMVAEQQLPPSCIIENGTLQCWCSLDEACRAFVRQWQIEKPKPKPKEIEDREGNKK